VSLLKVRDLNVSFRSTKNPIKVVSHLNFEIEEAHVFGLVGESGCGKSLTALSVMGILPHHAFAEGEINFKGMDLLKLDDESMRRLRGKELSMIFQEPMTSLNPVLTIGYQVAEVLTTHLGISRKEAFTGTVELLRAVKIPSPEIRIKEYPHQMSGGMRQRVMIAMGLSCHPKLLIADEPTTALDVTTQAVLLELMKDMVERFNTALVIVTNNLGVVARYATRIYVMYAGRVVESGTTKDIFAHPCHPYTIGLLSCIPRLDEPRGRKLVPIEGLPPNLVDMPHTCAFLPRCPYKIDKCLNELWPLLHTIHEQHEAACYVNLEEKVRELRQ
jgi:oligopeptide/dipeptide ABC transporter ATP-binding protein